MTPAEKKAPPVSHVGGEAAPAADPQMRTCRLCGEQKPVGEFGQHFANGEARPRGYCRQCGAQQRARTSRYGAYEATRRNKALRQLRARANKLASEAIERGELVPGPCACADQTCRGEVKPHHEDYALPLEVTWYCKSHHQRRHGQLRRMAAQHGQTGLFAAHGAVDEKRWKQKPGGKFTRRRGGGR